MLKKMSPTPSHVLRVVEAAMEPDYPDDGALLLKPLLLEGYRSVITDALLDLLQSNSAKDSEWAVWKATSLLYFLHGTGQAWHVPGVRNPRPEDVRTNEAMSSTQLDRLVDAASKERDPDNMDCYVSLLGCIWPNPEFSHGTVSKLKRFLKLCLEYGSEDTKSKARQIDIW